MLGEFDASFDQVVAIATAGWIGAAGATLKAQILSEGPSPSETVLEMLGTDPFTTLGGNYQTWGLYAGGVAVGEYGRVPFLAQLGSVAVPVVTSRVTFRGPLEVWLFDGSVKPTLSSFNVRVKGARSHRLTFRAEMLERFQPKPSALDRVRSALGRALGIA